MTPLVIAALVVIVAHGALHLIGFSAAFGKKPIKQLNQPVSKSMGLLWLTAAILFLVFAIMLAVHFDYPWIVGFPAITLSIFLIVVWWKDAKWGIIPNLLIFLVCMSLYGQYKFDSMISDDKKKLLSMHTPAKQAVVTEQAIETLPPPVKRWLQYAGVVGRPMITAGRIEQQIEMKLDDGAGKSLFGKATQYTLPESPALLWWADGRVNAFIRIQGREKYMEGRADKSIKATGLVTVAEEAGALLNESTAQRMLGEMVWFPTMALSTHVQWKAVNDTTAEATMRVGKSTGGGTFYFNAAGACTRFTAMRNMQGKAKSKKYLWTLDMLDYKSFDGIQVPTSLVESWTVEDNFLTWLRLKVKTLKFNEEALK